MKTKILLAITVMCLTSFSMHAQVSLNNANTVEALIGAYPDMPSASTLGALYVSSKSVAAQESIQPFHDKLNKIRDRYEVIKETSDEQSRANFTKGLDNKMRNDYGKSVDELQGMSDSERESWAMGLADKQLKKLGINKSAKQISAQGEMSEAEAQQMANQMAQSMSGMSMAEMQALASKLENMSEEEQIAYMQNNGMADRMMKNAGKVNQTSNASSKKAASMMKVQEEIIAIQKQCFITKRQGILKTRLTDCTRLDELQAQMMELQGLGNQVAVPSAYSVAEEYWNITGSVTQLPDGAMPEYEEQPNS